MQNRFFTLSTVVLVAASLGATSEAKKTTSPQEVLNKLNRTNQNRAVCQTTPTPTTNEEHVPATMPESKTDPWKWLNTMVYQSIENENLVSKLEMEMEGYGEGVKGAYENYLANLPYGKCRLKIDVIVRPSKPEDDVQHKSIAVKEFKRLEIVTSKPDCKGSEEECQEVIVEKGSVEDEYLKISKTTTPRNLLDPVLKKRSMIDSRCLGK
jgi:hypothetical protein